MKGKPIEWRTERMAVADLAPARYNPRTLSDKARADLTASVREFGEVEPVVANADGTLIGGHQRVKVYLDLGLEEITVRVPSRKLSAREEKALNLRLNRNVGEWDWAALRDLFDRDLLLDVGFSEEELSMNFGLEAADAADSDFDRMEVLTVNPPEAPRIRERAAIHFDTMEEYLRVKAAVESGRIGAAELLALS